MYPELLLYLATGSWLNLTIVRCSENEKSIIDPQKSDNAPYPNAEQELMKLLIKECNLHKKDHFLYQMYYIYS